MANKFRLLLLFLTIIVGSIVGYKVVKKVIQIQKNNDYVVCKSVVRIAQFTGKMDKLKTTHQICKYHLE